MMKPNIEWRYLFQFTLLPFLSLVVAAAALSWSYWHSSKVHQEFASLSANQIAMHEDYAALVTERRIIDRYHRRYQMFRDLGFVGLEDRVDWVESLRLATAGLATSGISYAIEPQLGVIAPVINDLVVEAPDIRVSRAQLEMNLAHEMELLEFFEALQGSAPGLISVRQCELTRVSAASDVGDKINLSANCDLETFSVITSDSHSSGT